MDKDDVDFLAVLGCEDNVQAQGSGISFTLLPWMLKGRSCYGYTRFATFVLRVGDIWLACTGTELLSA